MTDLNTWTCADCDTPLSAPDTEALAVAVVEHRMENGHWAPLAADIEHWDTLAHTALDIKP